MPLSPAEKQRRRKQRIRDDPARELAEREKDRKRWHQRKAVGSVKLVVDLSERDVRIRRRYWREDKRKKQVEKQRQNANMPPTTPPICLPRGRNVRRNNQRRIKLKKAKLQQRLNEERVSRKCTGKDGDAPCRKHLHVRKQCFSLDEVNHQKSRGFCFRKSCFSKCVNDTSNHAMNGKNRHT